MVISQDVFWLGLTRGIPHTAFLGSREFYTLPALRPPAGWRKSGALVRQSYSASSNKSTHFTPCKGARWQQEWPTLGLVVRQAQIPAAAMCHNRRMPPVTASTNGNSNGIASGDGTGAELEDRLMLRACQLAGASAGLTAPHPNSGCVLARDGEVVGEGFLYAQGTASAEAQAVGFARELAQGAVAYLNLEPGDCHGDTAAVLALLEAGVKKVVVGLLHPLPHLKGQAVRALQEGGMDVQVLGEGKEEVVRACRDVNAPLLFRATHRRPFSVLKYAMTLDGKIAASSGHAAWVTSTAARERVFAARACSDAIIVGGNTVRRDNPRLTTRQAAGHFPVRVVMSRTLRLPEDANLWDVSGTPTIVMTQRGARRPFQDLLRARGVEVVEFDFLNPAAVMDYCYQRGFLQVMWECGGLLSAPAIAAGAIHKVMAFIAPKIIGGVTAPSPVGELGFVEMTQALNLLDVGFEQVGSDMLMTGYLHPLPTGRDWEDGRSPLNSPLGVLVGSTPVIRFYKAWDPHGALSNFSPHPIVGVDEKGGDVTWQSVEHFYQSQKFHGVDDPSAQDAIRAIQVAPSPEEAARIGRRLERQQPHLMRTDWAVEKLSVMRAALHQKFGAHPGPRALLLSTAGSMLIEASPHDYFWGAGRTGTGSNHLGKLLMELREEILLGQSVNGEGGLNNSTGGSLNGRQGGEQLAAAVVRAGGAGGLAKAA